MGLSAPFFPISPQLSTVILTKVFHSRIWQDFRILVKYRYKTKGRQAMEDLQQELIKQLGEINEYLRKENSSLLEQNAALNARIGELSQTIANLN